MHLRGRLAALALLAGLWLLATGPAAAAHGVLQSSEPAGGSSLERAPAAVTLRFSERPDPRLSTVRVLDSGGRVVAGGPAQPVAGRPLELRVPAAGLPAGGYTVSWRIVSAVDGHRTDGVFGFGVGAAGAPQLPPSQAVAEVRTGPALGPLAVAGRWAWYWGLTLLVGAAATGLLVFGGRLPGRPVLLLGLALAAAAGGLVAMTAAARADAGVSLASVLGSTTGGWLLWRAAMLAAAGAAVGWLLARPGARGPLLAVGAAAGAGMLVHALAGHAAGPSSLRALNLLAQWAHLLAVGVWIGGLAWLLAGLWRHAGAGSTREVVVRFSKLAGISLAAVVATGVARTVDELGGWGRLLDSGFGRALDLKLVLFAGLVGLGALNRYRLVPLFQGDPRRRAVGRLRRSVGGELGLAAAVLAAAALLSQLPPGAPDGGRPPGTGGHAGPGGQRGGLGHDRAGDPDRDPGGGRAQPFHGHRCRLRHRHRPARRPGRAGRDAGVPPRPGHRPPGADRGGRRPLVRPGPPAHPGRQMEPDHHHPAPGRRRHRAHRPRRPTTGPLLTPIATVRP